MSIATAAVQLRTEDFATIRYESLIRLTESIRAQRDPDDLFRVLVHELRKVIPFDGIAQFDEAANKVNWHFCEPCRQPSVSPSDLPREESLAWWVYEHQRPLVLSDVHVRTHVSLSLRAA